MLKGASIATNAAQTASSAAKDKAKNSTNPTGGIAIDAKAAADAASTAMEQARTVARDAAIKEEQVFKIDRDMYVAVDAFFFFRVVGSCMPEQAQYLSVVVYRHRPVFEREMQ